MLRFWVPALLGSSLALAAGCTFDYDAYSVDSGGQGSGAGSSSGGAGAGVGSSSGGAGATGSGASSSGGSSSGGSDAGGAGGASGGSGGAGGSGGNPNCGNGVVDANEVCDDLLTGDPTLCSGCEVVCDSPAFLAPGTGHCYRRFNTGTSWDEARVACAAWRPGADLASLEDESEDDFVTGEFSGTTFICAEDKDEDNTWTWCTGNDVDYDGWDLTQPDNLFDDHCMGYFVESNDWHDLDCDIPTAYLCEWAP